MTVRSNLAVRRRIAVAAVTAAAALAVKPALIRAGVVAYTGYVINEFSTLKSPPDYGSFWDPELWSGNVAPTSPDVVVFGSDQPAGDNVSHFPHTLYFGNYGMQPFPLPNPVYVPGKDYSELAGVRMDGGQWTFDFVSFADAAYGQSVAPLYGNLDVDYGTHIGSGSGTAAHSASLTVRDGQFITYGPTTIGYGSSAENVGSVYAVGAGHFKVKYAPFVIGGGSGTGNLDVSQGAWSGAFFDNAYLTAAADPASTAVITLHDPGSRLRTFAPMTIADGGHATVTATTGSLLECYDGAFVAGHQPGSKAVITLSDDGTQFIEEGGVTAFVGDGGEARISVSQRATASFGSPVLGNAATGLGVVTVSGVGTNLSTHGALVVGNAGEGRLTISSGASASTGGGLSLAVAPGSRGSLAVNNATLAVGGDLALGGPAAPAPGAPVGGGATATAGVDGMITAKNLWCFAGSTLDLSGGGSLTLGGTNLASTAGAVVVGPGAAARGSGVVVGSIPGAAARGSGVVVGSMRNDGLVAPFGGADTNAAGTLTLRGSYAQGAGGTLVIKVSGPDAGAGYDQLVTGTNAATLAGRLAVTLDPAYRPAPYAPHTVLTYGSRTGRFDTVTGIDLGSGRGLAVIYAPTGVQVVAALNGDANLDHVVDFNDLVVLAQHYNGPAGSAWAGGDFTGDGLVDLNDLVKLAQNYNSALPASPVPGASTAFEQDLAAAFASVPEPGSLGALLLCVLAARRRARNQRTI